MIEHKCPLEKLYDGHFHGV